MFKPGQAAAQTTERPARRPTRPVRLGSALRSLAESFTLPAPFDPPAMEQAFLRDYGHRFAPFRRAGALLAFVLITAFAGWDYAHYALDPTFPLGPVLAWRAFSSLTLGCATACEALALLLPCCRGRDGRVPPVLVVSGEAGAMEMTGAANAAGADAVLLKPVQADQLRSAMLALVAARRAVAGPPAVSGAARTAAAGSSSPAGSAPGPRPAGSCRRMAVP